MNKQTDSVDIAIESLSAARWTGEPDWRRLQEKIMSTKRFGWKHAVFAAALAGGCFAAGAASGIAWDRFNFTGVMHLNNGGVAQVVGEAQRAPDGTMEVRLDAGGADITGGGVMDMTLPDGTKAQLVTKSVDAKDGQEFTLPDGRKVWVPKGVDAEKLLKSGKLKQVPLR